VHLELLLIFLLRLVLLLVRNIVDFFSGIKFNFPLPSCFVSIVVIIFESLSIKFASKSAGSPVLVKASQ